MNDNSIFETSGSGILDENGKTHYRPKRKPNMDRKTTLLVNLYEAYEGADALRDHYLEEFEFELEDKGINESEYLEGIDEGLGDILEFLWNAICFVKELKVKEE